MGAERKRVSPPAPRVFMPLMLAGLLTPTFDPSSIAPWDLMGFDVERAIDALEVLEHVDCLKNEKRRKPKPKSHATRLDWIKRIDRLSPMAFRRRCRMPSELFHKTCDDAGPRLEKCKRHSSSEDHIPTELSLSMTLRLPAGGSHLDTADLHGVAERSVHCNFWRTLDAMNECCKIGFDPSNETQVRELEAGFGGLSTNQAIKGCMRAMDGLSVKMRRPSDKETPHVKRFHCRKNCHALNLQAVCDSDCRFIAAGTATGGSGCDSVARKMMKSCKQLLNGALEVGHFLIGDAACGVHEFLTSPFTGQDLGDEKSNCNFAVSQQRITTECAFGRLVGRFGTLWSPMRFHCRKAGKIVLACMKLHNLTTSRDIAKAVERDRSDTACDDEEELMRIKDETIAELRRKRIDAKEGVAQTQELIKECKAGHAEEKDSRAEAVKPPKCCKLGLTPIELLNDEHVEPNLLRVARAVDLRSRLVEEVKRAGVVRPPTP
eukprot:jgi/Bigna1/82035/fgenesh1_pg.87_\